MVCDLHLNTAVATKCYLPKGQGTEKRVKADVSHWSSPEKRKRTVVWQRAQQCGEVGCAPRSCRRHLRGRRMGSRAWGKEVSWGQRDRQESVHRAPHVIP